MKTYAFRLHRGDDLRLALTRFARENHLRGAVVRPAKLGEQPSFLSGREVSQAVLRDLDRRKVEIGDLIPQALCVLP